MLISLGPYSDEILDVLQIPDTVLPGLHRLTTTIRSGRWISVLEGPEFALSHEKATILASALLKDVKAVEVMPKASIYLISISYRNSNPYRSVTASVGLFLGLLAF